MKKYILLLFILFTTTGCTSQWVSYREELHLYITTDASWIATIGGQRYTGNESAIINLGRAYECWTVVKTSGSGVIFVQIVGVNSGKLYSTESRRTAHNPIRGCN
jgi:hypothetical protein